MNGTRKKRKCKWKRTEVSETGLGTLGKSQRPVVRSEMQLPKDTRVLGDRMSSEGVTEGDPLVIKSDRS